MRKIYSAIVFFLILLFPTKVVALEHQYITLVNPVRISEYSISPLASLKAQYGQVKKFNFSATWLVTYDVLENPELVEFLKEMDKKQEIGLFLEVSEKMANRFSVPYNKTDSWHRASSVFLSGYKQPDRLKIIDGVFNLFHEKFGYYPKSTGAWWVDSYSLEYMNKKYGVDTNLAVADQFSTDGYQVWGQYWSMPFYPSKSHAAVPATSQSNKIDVVMLQWAPRDPLNGYFSPSEKRASLYSSQDYFTLGLDDDYYNKLIMLYGLKNKNPIGQITLGLEGDFTEDAYINGKYPDFLKSIKEMSGRWQIEVVNMRDFAKIYKSKFKGISPSFVIESNDLLGRPEKIVWFMSPYYRLGLKIDLSGKNHEIFDFRAYSKDMFEPYYISPNRELELFINVPSLFDRGNYEKDFWRLNLGKFKSLAGDSNNFKVEFEKGEVIFLTNEIKFQGNFGDLPPAIKNAEFLIKKFNKDKLDIIFKDKWIANPEFVIWGLKPEADNFLKQKRFQIGLIITIIILSIYYFILIGIKKYKLLLIIFPISVLSFILLSFIFNSSEKYLITQSEVDALFRLKWLDAGDVLVNNHSCLQCQYNTNYKPAGLINKDYVGKLSGKNIIFDNEIIETTAGVNSGRLSREQIKQKLSNLSIDYIYLFKFEGYEEKLPYSPGDLGVEKIYANANTEIWRVK